MKTDGLLVLKYHNNFADNFTSLAYGKILENISKRKCCFENSSKERTFFEDKMSDFNMDYDYISTSRVKEITDRAFNFNKVLVNEENIERELKKKKTTKNKIVDLKHFNIEDISYISDDIKEMFDFRNKDFIVHYDIYEDILQSNSIGLYISRTDYKNVNSSFIKKAVTRLNKYIKKPKLFIFSSKEIENKLDIDINYEIFSLYDWREEFMFLKSCKHKILCNLADSYSESFWASVLGNKEYSITIYESKDVKNKILRENWIGI